MKSSKLLYVRIMLPIDSPTPINPQAWRAVGLQPSLRGKTSKIIVRYRDELYRISPTSILFINQCWSSMVRPHVECLSYKSLNSFISNSDFGRSQECWLSLAVIFHFQGQTTGRLWPSCGTSLFRRLLIVPAGHAWSYSAQEC